MTYQAASGAGAQNMRELLQQMGDAHARARRRCSTIPSRRSSTSTAKSPASCATSAFRPSTSACRSAGSLIPWIDKDLGNGMSREEWKGGAETNKILGRGAGATRCPDRIDLRARRRDALPQPGADDQAAARRAARRHRGACSPPRNEWVRVVPNNRDASIRELTPAAVTGKLDDPVGRLRKLAMGPRIPRRIHRRRPAAVGRGRAAAPDAADSRPARRSTASGTDRFGPRKAVQAVSRYFRQLYAMRVGRRPPFAASPAGQATGLQHSAGRGRRHHTLWRECCRVLQVATPFSTPA